MESSSPGGENLGLDFLSGGGEMGALIRNHDWAATTLGSPDKWLQSLRTVVRLILNTRHPMYIWWGPDLLCFYNDAYRQSIGPEHHPGSLGRPAREVWAEIWQIIGPQIHQVLSGGGATWQENALVPITRNGRREDVYWTYSYGPIDDEKADGGVGGVLVVCTETTHFVQTEKKLRESEARYRRIVEGAEDFAIIALDENGKISAWNRGAERLIGFTDKEAIGQSGSIFFTAEDVASGIHDHELNQARAHGRSVNERWHQRKDGSRFWGSGLTMYLGGNGDGYLKMFRDRTIEHVAEANLRTSEDRLRFFADLESRLFGATGALEAMSFATEMLGSALGASRCAYADVDADSDRFWIRNDYVEEGQGSSVGEYSLDLFGPRAASEMRRGEVLVVNDVAAELAPGEGREMFQAIAIEAIICCPLIRNGRLAAMMAVHQDKVRHWGSDEISLIRDVVERCWAHVERVGAEARLRESEERLRLAVDNAEVGFGTWMKLMGHSSGRREQKQCSGSQQMRQ